jgi:glycosyltransferase involved in cell wall biosynthesis
MPSGGLRTKGITKQSQENMPLITVVTVVRNGEAMLEETILSVINQTYQNIEYIIVDGASTDGTLDIVRKYEDRIDYWISEPDEGIYDAMNKGIRLAIGEFIGFLNSGDSYVLNSCETVSEVIIKNKNAGIVYGNTDLLIPLWGKQYHYNIKPSPTIDERIKTAQVFCHQSSFERIDLFETYGFFENVIATGEWIHFVTLFNNKIHFLYIDKTISNYLYGGISSTVKGFREGILYKKKFGTFKYADYFRLMISYLRDTFFYKNIVFPIRWTIKLFLISENK